MNVDFTTASFVLAALMVAIWKFGNWILASRKAEVETVDHQECEYRMQRTDDRLDTIDRRLDKQDHKLDQIASDVSALRVMMGELAVRVEERSLFCATPPPKKS